MGGPEGTYKFIVHRDDGFSIEEFYGLRHYAEKRFDTLSSMFDSVAVYFYGEGALINHWRKS